MSHIWRPKKNKYKNIATTIGQRTFDSKLEANFWLQYLLPLSKKNKWTVKFQEPFDLVVNGTKICEYVADFYIPETKTIWEVKGVYTEVSKLKMRLAQALLEKEIIIVRSLSKFEKVRGYNKRK